MTATRRLVLTMILLVGVSGLVWRVLTRSVAPPGMITPRLIDFLHTAAPVPEGSIDVPIRVAVVSLPSDSIKALNLARMEQLASQAKHEHPDTRVVVFGEASLGLYVNPHDPGGYQRRVAESLPGPASDRLGALAHRLEVYLAYGAVELAGDTLFNTLVVLDPTGAMIARHRKMLLHEFDRRNGITVADSNHQVIEIDGVRFGLSVCADANSAWLARTYRREGIDVLLYSVTSKVVPTARWLRYWPYAARYRAWIVAANRYGQEGTESYPGTIFVAAPNGRVQAIGDLEGGYLTAIVGRRDRGPRDAPR